jgi:hypothetical protein
VLRTKWQRMANVRSSSWEWDGASWHCADEALSWGAEVEGEHFGQNIIGKDSAMGGAERGPPRGDCGEEVCWGVGE